MKYSKPHLSWDEQVRLLKERGMHVQDDAEAVRTLQRIGYYRFSGYSHPFRELEPPTSQGRSAHPVRRDSFRSGTAFTDVVALHDFDARLRRTFLDGLQALEVGVRTQVAYRVGARSPVGHLDRAALDERACNRALPRRQTTAYEAWRAEYDKLQRSARNEDSVRHFAAKYEGVVPIWAACEFLTMGCLVSLLQLMVPADRRRIAAGLGVKNPQVLDGWLRALNVTRNHCAHNSRLWNRSTIYPPDKINERMVGSELHHLRRADSDRIYVLAALTGYLLRRIDPSTGWPHDFVATMSTFPQAPGVDLASSSGFPEGWQGLRLWN